MNPQSKKFVALLLVLSLLVINCITFKLPGRKATAGIPSESKQNIISRSEVEKIKPGTSIVVTLNTGFLVSGKYAGLSLIRAEEYAENYAKCREQIKEEIVLPELGETVTVITKTGKQHELGFFGFDYGTILIRVEGMGRTRIASENISLVKNIVDSRGNIIELETVRKLISEGKISLPSSGIIIKQKAGRTQIAWEDIYQIKVKKKGMPLFAKLALVAAGTATIALILIKEIEQEIEKINESCSISSTTYNSPLYPYMDILRDFRNTYLLPSKLGRKMVNLYYKYSPFVAYLIAKHKPLKFAAQISLIPMIAFSYSMLHFGPVITAVILILLLVLSVFLTSFFRRKLRRLKTMQPWSPEI